MLRVRCSVLLSRMAGMIFGLAVFLDPSLRRTLTLELGNDAVRILAERLTHASAFHTLSHHLLYDGIQLTCRHLLLLPGYLNALVGNYFPSLRVNLNEFLELCKSSSAFQRFAGLLDGFGDGKLFLHKADAACSVG